MEPFGRIRNPTIVAEKRLVAYAASAAGTLVMSPGVDAALVVKTVEQAANGGSLAFDIGAFAADAVDFAFSASGGDGDFSIYASFDQVRFNSDNDDSANSNGVSVELLTTDGFEARNVNVGESVTTGGSTGALNAYVAEAPSRSFLQGFAQDVRDYSGFQLTVSGRTHFGWFDFTATNDGGATLHRVAIETTANTGALVTAVPEPAHTAAIFALGAAGLAAYRRRRAAASQA